MCSVAESLLCNTQIGNETVRYTVSVILFLVLHDCSNKLKCWNIHLNSGFSVWYLEGKNQISSERGFAKSIQMFWVMASSVILELVKKVLSLELCLCWTGSTLDRILCWGRAWWNWRQIMTFASKSQAWLTQEAQVLTTAVWRETKKLCLWLYKTIWLQAGGGGGYKEECFATGFCRLYMMVSLTQNLHLFNDEGWIHLICHISAQQQVLEQY
jgi:hypothetical protein